VSYKKIKEILTNYPKYYSYDFLFKKATVDLGDFVSRHSIRGNGIFLQISSALLLLSFIGLIFDKDKKKYKLIPFFILFFLYSIPDLITTKNNVPPYTFSLFTIIYFLPFLSAYGLDFLIRFLSKDKMFKNIVIYAIFIILVFQIGQFLNNYNKYPLYSSDYWGWQYGPKEIIKYFIKEKNNYDEFYMTGSFNQPISLLNFYNYKKNCKSCFIGGINEYNSSKKQLYAIRTSEINEISKSHPSLIFKEINSIKLPNGYKEFLIGTFQEQ
jgi:hypothetical protein